MNAYDFDHCIYAGDCTIDFYRYCLKKNTALLYSSYDYMLESTRYI